MFQTTPESRPIQPARIRLRQLTIALPVLAWLIGAALFLRADGSIDWPLQRTSQPPESVHNLALYQWGPTLRASSYFRGALSQHHPIFLVDARDAPGEVEKWTSGVHDRQPWTEILWREPRRLERVVIRHAGTREAAQLTIRRYRLACLLEAGREGPAVSVTQNTESVATHPLACERARGVRVEWTANDPGDQVRVYEIEAWGR